LMIDTVQGVYNMVGALVVNFNHVEGIVMLCGMDMIVWLAFSLEGCSSSLSFVGLNYD